tara:strand:+ start:19 stop:1092 length:1074 start_codon:yes stop_codon:yes gene_type:complete
MKTLFKKDSKGKIRVWTVYSVDFEDGTSQLIQKSGLKDGKLVEHSKYCIGKNIGKSNETDPSKQAILELKSLVCDKLSEGYFLTEDEAENEKVILPVLAKDYKKESKKVDWDNCFIQRKYDGMRCLAHCKSDGSVTLVSRDGKIIENMQHIINDLSKIKDDIIIDGELWCEGTFQDNMKLIKKYRKGETEKIKYNIYDVVSYYSFNSRFALLKSTINETNNLKFVETIRISNEEDILQYHKQFISEGFEGTMVRTGVNGYQINKRSSDLLKYKDFSDIALTIIDITPNESNPLHGTPHFELNGKRFKAGCKMSHDDRADLLLNKQHYIGKTAEIRYFELTDDGILRFPVMVGIRLDK